MNNKVTSIDEKRNFIITSEPNKATLTPEWGIKPPHAVPIFWGARAIFSRPVVPARGKVKAKVEVSLDTPWDRQGMVGGTADERQLFSEWINKKGLPELKRLIGSGEFDLYPADKAQIEHTLDGVTLACSPRGSHGYMYIGIWPSVGMIEASKPTVVEAPPVEKVDEQRIHKAQSIEDRNAKAGFRKPRLISTMADVAMIDAEEAAFHARCDEEESEIRNPQPKVAVVQPEALDPKKGLRAADYLTDAAARLSPLAKVGTGALDSDQLLRITEGYAQGDYNELFDVEWRSVEGFLRAAHDFVADSAFEEFRDKIYTAFTPMWADMERPVTPKGKKPKAPFYAVVIEPGKKPTLYELRDGELASLQAVVGGMIQLVPFFPNPKYTVYVNEEGLLLRLPFNRKRVVNAKMPMYGVHEMFGNILITQNKGLKIDAAVKIIEEWSK